MIVTDKKYFLEKKYVEKLDLMIKRLKGTDDVVLPIDGDEGQGKTELAIATCYYIAYNTGRHYGIDNIFFDLDKLLKFASTTKDQIIHFDEGAFGLLSMQWQSKAQQKFLQLVMVARKKRHFIIICIPKFHKLPQYVIEERSIGLVHVYSRKNLQKGRFCYFKKDSKDALYQDWNRKRIKNYKKYNDFHGTFPEASKRVFTDAERDEYDKKKDEAIMGLTQENKMGVHEKRWFEQRNKLIAGMRIEYKLTAKELMKKIKQYDVTLSCTEIKDITRDYEELIKQKIAEKLTHADDASLYQ